MSTFVFLHVGTDTHPKMLVQSIHRLMPDAEIIQCSDSDTAEVEGVSHVSRTEGDIANLMTFRLEAFMLLELDRPAAYIDSDMLMTRAFDPALEIGPVDALCCRRSFDTTMPFNTTLRGMNMTEHEGKTMGMAYPILACFTVTAGNWFWTECQETLAHMDPQYHRWYGDQEAMREVYGAGKLDIRTIKESDCACLPEHLLGGQPPLFVHFKGKRKAEMAAYFEGLTQIQPAV